MLSEERKRFEGWVSTNFDELQAECCEYHLGSFPKTKCLGTINWECEYTESCPYLEKWCEYRWKDMKENKDEEC